MSSTTGILNKQTNQDLTTAAAEVADINSLKQKAALQPNKALTPAQAAELMTDIAELKTSEASVNSDMHKLTAAGDADEVAHIADFMNQLNNIAQNTSIGLETGNALDTALAASGATAGEFHTALSDLTNANSTNLNYANQVAPNSDTAYNQVVLQADVAAQPGSAVVLQVAAPPSPVQADPLLAPYVPLLQPLIPFDG